MTVPLERQKNVVDVATRLRGQMGAASAAQGAKADTALQPETGVFRVASFAGAPTASIPVSVNRVFIEDRKAHFARVGSEPVHDLKFQNGAQWWEIDETVIDVRMAGAVGNGVADDAPVIQSAINRVAAMGGGIVFFPKPRARYKCNSTLTVQSSYVELVGESQGIILDFSASISGAGISLSGVYYFSVKNISVLNSFAAGIEVIGGTPQDYAAYGHFENLYVRNARNNRDCIEITTAFKITFKDVFVHEGSRCGIGVYGFSTTLVFENVYALACGSHGIYFEDVMGFDWSGGASDGNGGYGFYCKDVSGTFHTPYAENNQYSMFHFRYDSGTTNLQKGIRVSINTPQPFNNNWNAIGGAIKHAGVGHFITTSVTGSGSASSLTAGSISISNFEEFNAALTGKHIEGSGAFQYSCDSLSLSRLTWATSIGFGVVGDAATDIVYPLPINVTGASTRIATLGPKLRNGVSAYGGRITVSVSQNNRSSGSKFAVYELLVSRGVGFSEVKLVSSAGLVAGAASDEPSFTFSLDVSTETLRVSPVGSTATGNWYFALAVQGNLSAIMG